MKNYRYVVRAVALGWSVLAHGPRGGTRWIGTYLTQRTADRVAQALNENEGK